MRVSPALSRVGKSHWPLTPVNLNTAPSLLTGSRTQPRGHRSSSPSPLLGISTRMRTTTRKRSPGRACGVEIARTAKGLRASRTSSVRDVVAVRPCGSVTRSVTLTVPERSNVCVIRGSVVRASKTPSPSKSHSKSAISTPAPERSSEGRASKSTGTPTRTSLGE